MFVSLKDATGEMVAQTFLGNTVTKKGVPGIFYPRNVLAESQKSRWRSGGRFCIFWLPSRKDLPEI